MLKSSNHCVGFTLVEVLIALVLGLSLIGVVLQNYLSAKNIYNAQTEMSHLSGNIRFAEFFLQQNIMVAGYAGCRKISELNLTNHTDMVFSSLNAICGYDSNSLPNYLVGKVVAGSDVVVITKANSDITSITADIKQGATSFKVGKNPATQTNRILLISDCKNGDLFTAKNWSSGTVTSKNALNSVYRDNNAQVARFEELAFFISDTGRVTAKKQPIYSLYFLINRGNRRELIPQISKMEIVYGVDPQGQGKVTNYLKAAAITAANLWDKVLSVKITLQPQHQSLALKQWQIYIKLRERG